jgi:hypothetical protein
MSNVTTDDIDGLFAYYTGSGGDGVSYEGIREELKGMKTELLIKLLTEVVSNYIEDPYNIYDVAEFVTWCKEELGMKIRYEFLKVY